MNINTDKLYRDADAASENLNLLAHVLKSLPPATKQLGDIQLLVEDAHTLTELLGDAVDCLPTEVAKALKHGRLGSIKANLQFASEGLTQLLLLANLIESVEPAESQEPK